MRDTSSILSIFHWIENRKESKVAEVPFPPSNLPLDMNWFIGIMTTWKNGDTSSRILSIFHWIENRNFHPSNLPLARKPEGKKVAEVSSTLPSFQSSIG
jgi:hypothetical protein